MKPMQSPRALRGPVRAETQDQLLAQINGAVGDLSTKLKARLSGCEETIQNVLDGMNAMQRSIDGGMIGAPGASAILPAEPEYTRAFDGYFRKGDGSSEAELSAANAIGDRAAIRAAMSVGSDSDGGYLAPVELDRKINQAQMATSPMRRLAKVVSTSVGAYSTLWNDNQWGSGWVGETAARPLTTNAHLSPLTFSSGEIYAQPTATQRLLDDAYLDVAAWLVESLRTEFSRQESIAFWSGDGVNKPTGLLQYITGGAADGAHPGGNITVVDEAIGVDALIDFSYGLAAPYRQTSRWAMNSQTAAQLTKLKDADGNLVWRESTIVGQPATLFGRPVELDESLPGPDAGSIAIAFGSFVDAYLINDRIGVRVLRDPYTNKPFVNFYATKRVGGGLLDPNAVRLLRIPV